MKEVQPLDQDKVTIVKQVQQLKQTLVGRIRPHKGHTLFEVNLSNGVVKEAEVRCDVIVRYKNPTFKEGCIVKGNSENKITNRVDVNPHCIYVSALNAKNLMKKLIKKGILTATPEADAN